MVNNEEISDNEAMFRYLNLIDIEISKNIDIKYNYYPEYYNDYFRDVCYQFILEIILLGSIN